MKFFPITMKTTALVVTILVIVLGIYDAIAVAYGVITGQKIAVTVSSYLIHVGFEAPMVVFMVGFVSGHLFGYVTVHRETEKFQDALPLAKKRHEDSVQSSEKPVR